MEPESIHEENVLRMLIHDGANPVLWLGITDFRKYGHFVKDSNGEELTYTNWVINSPTDDWVKRGRYHCTYMPMVSDNNHL